MLRNSFILSHALKDEWKWCKWFPVAVMCHQQLCFQYVIEKKNILCEMLWSFVSASSLLILLHSFHTLALGAPLLLLPCLYIFFFSLKLFFLILFLSFLSFTFVCPWPRMGWRMMHLPLRPSKDYWSGSKAQSCAEVKQWCIRVSLVITNILHACIQADYELYQA